jgi:hypothetical protein
MLFLRQSTASQEVLLGPFVSDTDGKTAQTGLTIANTDIKLWVEGATTEASKTSGGATHIASGRYYAVLDATDTATVGKLEINVHVAGALPVRREFHVLEEAVYDAMFAASAAGYQVPIWAASNSTVNLSGTTIATTQKVDVDTIKTNPVVNAGTVTFPTGATLASTTNITAASGVAVSSIGTDVISAASVAAAAVTKIQNGLATTANVSAVETDTQDIQSRLPAALTGDGNMKADALRLGGTLQTGRDVGASVLLSSGTGTGQVKLSGGYVAPNWGDVGNPTTTVGLSGTTIKTATDVETDTADIQNRIPTSLSAGRMRADLEAIGGNAGGVSNLNDFAVSCYDAGLHQVLLVATTTTAGALGTTAKSDVNTEVAAALTTYDAVTQADLDARTLLAAEYATEALLSHVDGNVDAIDITADAIKLKTDNLPSDPADASDIAGSFTTVNGKLDTIDDFLDTEVAAIKAKTDQLTFTVANQVDSNALSGGGSGLDAAGVRSALGMASANLDTQLGTIDTVVDGIAAKTVNLPASPAATGDIPSAATNASAVRTELATELARVDVATSTRLASASYTAPPSASTNASAVRTELTTELGRMDAAVSTRATPAQVATELATYDGPTNAEMVARTLTASAYATATALQTVDDELAVVDGVVDSILSGLAGLSTLTQAQVLAKVNEALDTAVSEATSADFIANPSLRRIGAVQHANVMNDNDDNATRRRIKNSAGSVIAQATVASSGSGVSQGKLAAP